MRKLILALLTVASFTSVGAATTQAAADYPYWKLDYRRFDSTYEHDDAVARRFASFIWDGKAFCRYRSGWNGPGVYQVGTRSRRGHGWDGGYPWQGPGTPADHEDEQAFEQYRADYAHAFGRAGECGSRAYRRHHFAHVLRRLD